MRKFKSQSKILIANKLRKMYKTYLTVSLLSSNHTLKKYLGKLQVFLIKGYNTTNLN